MKRRVWIWSVIKSLLLSFILVFITIQWILRPVVVVGNSMYPTLHNNDKGFSVIFNRESVERFDVVVLKTKQDLIVKRIIGLPHEVIEVKEDVLYINGQVVEQPFLDQEYVDKIKLTKGHFTNDFGPITLGEDEYFVMGDNRPYSQDSRSLFGAFHRSQIVSKGVFILYPFDHIQIVGY